MADDPLPFIEMKDYGAFQRSFEKAGLPDYDEWLKVYNREKSDRESKGYNCYPVQVDPDNFVTFCLLERQEPKEVDYNHFLDLLLRFAFTITKAEPQRVISDYDPLDSKD